MATHQALRGMQAGACSSHSVLHHKCAAPFSSKPSSRRARSRVVRVQAAEDAAASLPAVSRTPPVPEWPVDTESIRDVFAFAGSAPERVNGRMAMLGFLGIALAELKGGGSALEQLGDDWFGVLLLSVSITLATIFPKLVSGNSLKDLHAAATGDNLKGDGVASALALFDTNVELWTGRIAMLGVTGLGIVEAVLNKPFF